MSHYLAINKDLHVIFLTMPPLGISDLVNAVENDGSFGGSLSRIYFNIETL